MELCIALFRIFHTHIIVYSIAMAMLGLLDIATQINSLFTSIQNGNFQNLANQALPLTYPFALPHPFAPTLALNLALPYPFAQHLGLCPP